MNARLCMLTLVLLPAPSVYAQSGVLTGIARDSRHHPVSAAKVYLQRVGGKEMQSVQTDSTGAYRFKIAPGTYTLRAEDDQLEQASTGPFAVRAGQVTTIDLTVQAQYFDEPQFTVAGVTDNTYRGGHGSDTVLRSTEALTKETAALGHANAAERAGNPLRAVHELQRAAQSNPSEDNLFDWGTELLAHQAFQAATEVFAKGVRLFPRSARMQLGVASAQYAAGAYEQAAESFFKATDLDPADARPYLFLSQVQRAEITQSAGYEERLERFAKLHPENALANYYYAVSLWNHQDSEKALTLLEKSVVLDPHLGPAYLQLGIIHAAQGDYPRALREYQSAVGANPDLEEAHYRLSEAYRITGDSGKAAQELSTYHKLSQASAEKLERERRDVQQFVISLRAQ